jgi:hypothetical protein
MDDVLNLLLGPTGTLVLALFILFSGWKRWWVFGWHYKEQVAEKNEWKKAALRGTQLAEKVVDIQKADKELSNDS